MKLLIWSATIAKPNSVGSTNAILALCYQREWCLEQDSPRHSVHILTAKLALDNASEICYIVAKYFASQSSRYRKAEEERMSCLRAVHFERSSRGPSG